MEVWLNIVYSIANFPLWVWYNHHWI